MMNFMKQQGIVLSANLHDGSELVNYPWDCRFARHADDSWYRYISRQFADTVHRYGPAGIFMDEDNGITNGYDWYSIYGGRQDYVNHFIHGREITIELSHTKTPDPSKLPSYWNSYKRSLIGYMMHIHAGVYGNVFDAANGESLEAMIEIPGYDKDSSQVFSSPETGEFYRLLLAGNYIFKAGSAGYQTQQVEFSLAHNETKKITISLLPAGKEFFCFPNPFNHTLNFLLSDDSVQSLNLSLVDASGKILIRQTIPVIGGSAGITGLGTLPHGVYLIKITSGSFTKEFKVIK
jgi:hypothetical protein